MICPVLPQPKQVYLEEFESLGLGYLLFCWFLFLLFFLRNLLNLFVRRLIVSLSSTSSFSSLISSSSVAFSARPLDFLSVVSYSLSLLSSSSCSISFPNSAVDPSFDRSRLSDMAVTFGCQLLLRHFNIFMLSSSLSNSFPNPVR